jgi:hypothetical protein
MLYFPPERLEYPIDAPPLFTMTNAFPGNDVDPVPPEVTGNVEDGIRLPDTKRCPLTTVSLSIAIFTSYRKLIDLDVDD